MSPDLDIETLRLLVAIAEAGSLSGAAQARGISQPAASARLRSFEARWRLRVVERSPRGSTLTTDGLAVVSWARTVLHEADTMRAALAALTDERGSAIEVAASLTIAGYILPKWLGELRSRLDDVQPRLHVVNSDRVAELVRTQAVEIGFIETAVRPTDLAHRVVGSDRMIVVVAPDHPWARRSTPVDDATLREASWVLRESGSGTRSTFERALRSEPAMALEVSSTTALIGAALAGVGPAVITARAVTNELETGRLCEVSTDLDLMRPLLAIWRPDRRMSEPAAALLRIAVTHLTAQT